MNNVKLEISDDDDNANVTIWDSDEDENFYEAVDRQIEKDTTLFESEKRKRPLSPSPSTSTPKKRPSRLAAAVVEAANFFQMDQDDDDDEEEDGFDDNDFLQEANSLLTVKEKRVDSFLKRIMEKINEAEGASNNVAADLTHQRRVDLVREIMNECSMVLSHKFQPILQAALENQEAIANNQRFAEIEEVPVNAREMASNYLVCFRSFIYDKENVDLKAGNRTLIKNIEIRDAFTLTYWAMLTVRRQLGDNLLMISITIDFLGHQAVH